MAGWRGSRFQVPPNRRSTIGNRTESAGNRTTTDARHAATVDAGTSRFHSRSVAEYAQSVASVPGGVSSSTFDPAGNPAARRIRCCGRFAQRHLHRHAVRDRGPGLLDQPEPRRGARATGTAAVALAGPRLPSGTPTHGRRRPAADSSLAPGRPARPTRRPGWRQESRTRPSRRSVAAPPGRTPAVRGPGARPSLEPRCRPTRSPHRRPLRATPAPARRSATTTRPPPRAPPAPAPAAPAASNRCVSGTSNSSTGGGSWPSHRIVPTASARCGPTRHVTSCDPVHPSAPARSVGRSQAWSPRQQA